MDKEEAVWIAGQRKYIPMIEESKEKPMAQNVPKQMNNKTAAEFSENKKNVLADSIASSGGQEERSQRKRGEKYSDEEDNENKKGKPTRKEKKTNDHEPIKGEGGGQDAARPQVCGGQLAHAGKLVS